MAVIKITEVWLDNANCDIETGMGTYLVVYLSNGQNLTVSLDPKAGEPLFADVITKPKQKRMVSASTGITAQA